MTSKWRPNLALVVLIALGLFSALQLKSNGQDQARTRERTTRWQYREEVSAVVDIQLANKLGGEGWELVEVYMRQDGQDCRAVYKRKS